jgi:hypothetical protein
VENVGVPAGENAVMVVNQWMGDIYYGSTNITAESNIADITIRKLDNTVVSVKNLTVNKTI